jgi:hypothetical protein
VSKEGLFKDERPPTGILLALLISIPVGRSQTNQLVEREDFDSGMQSLGNGQKIEAKMI